MSISDTVDEYVAAAQAEMDRQKEAFLSKNLRGLPAGAWDNFELLEGPLRTTTEGGRIQFRQTIVLRHRSLFREGGGHEVADGHVSTAVKPSDVINAERQKSERPQPAEEKADREIRRRLVPSWLRNVSPVFLFGLGVGAVVGTWTMYFVATLS